MTDGDTVVLSRLGDVRLIGIDTPEVFGGVECFGRRASAFTKRVLRPRRRVRYRLGVERRDRYGRALAYVRLRGGRLFNLLLVERGYAQPFPVPPNVAFAKRIVEAARRARRRGRGLWGVRGCAVSPGDTKGGERDCSDFRTQETAQGYFDERGGGPGRNVDGLDGPDGDGRVCESLP